MITLNDKRKITLGIICIIYIILMTYSYFFADKYVNDKSWEMRIQAVNNLNSYFENKKKYIDLTFNAYRVDYQQIPIPSVMEPTYFDAISRINAYEVFDSIGILKHEYKKETIEEAQDAIRQIRQQEWNEEYGDKREMYELDVDPEGVYNSGWALTIVSNRDNEVGGEGFIVYHLYPSRLAYKKVSPFLLGSIPSIETALQTALEFMTSDAHSDLAAFYEKGCTNGLIESICADVTNDYWIIEKDAKPTIWWADSEISYGPNTKPTDAGFMHNGYFKVYFCKTQPVTYSLREVSEDVLEHDKYTIRFIAWGILSFIMICFFIPLYRKISKYSKAKTETLYDQLLRLCSPSNFMNPYNKEMVEKANNIYMQLKESNPQDINVLKEIRRQAHQMLGISFFSHERLEELKKRCNPTHFMNPYQPEKVKLSNELFATLTKESLDIDELEAVEKRIEELYNDDNKKQEDTLTEKGAIDNQIE